MIVYRRDDNNDDIYISVGNRGSWTSSQVASNRNAMYLAVAIDSNDDVHISSHNSGGSSKDLEYFTNSSGSWVRKTLDSGVGGMFGSIVVDNNDDIHIAHADAIGANDLQYATAKGSGKGLAVNPVFSVSPALPDGLILNWKTGEITGTPTVASANTTYTLTAVALGATTTATFTLHVTGVPGDISYNDILGTNGVAITPVAPTISTNSTTGSISSWAINATLPTGLTFETSNGTIWGTPTQVISGAVYTIWANNSAGSKSTTINITIDDLSVSSITYTPENITLSYYHTMTTSTPTTTGEVQPLGQLVQVYLLALLSTQQLGRSLEHLKLFKLQLLHTLFGLTTVVALSLTRLTSQSTTTLLLQSIILEITLLSITIKPLRQ